LAEVDIRESGDVGQVRAVGHAVRFIGSDIIRPPEQREYQGRLHRSRPLAQIGSCLTPRSFTGKADRNCSVAARVVMILWTNLAVAPAEIVFDAIEAELERRGVEL
jgi:hypothetical protein